MEKGPVRLTGLTVWVTAAERMRVWVATDAALRTWVPVDFVALPDLTPTPQKHTFRLDGGAGEEEEVLAAEAQRAAGVRVGSGSGMDLDAHGIKLELLSAHWDHACVHRVCPYGHTRAGGGAGAGAGDS